MDYTPPITQRSDKELLNIISNDETWAKEIQLQAEEELYRRNLSKEFVEAEKQKRVRLLATIHKRKADKRAKNKAESYTASEMFLIILWFPFSLLLLFDPLSDFIKLDAGNYKKKIRQRIILIVVSCLLWFQLLRIII